MEKIRATLGRWAVFSILCGSIGLAAALKAERMVIEIVPIGKIDAVVLKHLQRNLEDIFKADLLIKKEAENLPEKAYDAARRQYLSLPILIQVAEIRRQENERILGVMDEDVYTPGLNFIFGQADSAAGVALISLTRLRQDFYKLPPNDSLFLERALKEAVHELGHLFGLGHCPNPRCVMHFSNSLTDTDRKDSRFCSSCQKRLR